MIAAIGAACRMMNTGRLSHSTVRESPMPMPKPMPAAPHSAMPMASGCSVMRYAFPRLPSAIICHSAAAVWLAGGKAALIGQRPANSHKPKKRTKEASCHASWPGVRVKRLLELRERCLQRDKVPEVLDLGVRVLDRPRKRVKLEIVLRRGLAAAVVREDAVGRAFLEVGQDFLFQLGGQVLEQAELFALLQDRLRILVDLAVDAK